jgi:hypothetical protein
MIKKPTVLVLGAGASCAYGFPTGADLAVRVIREFSTKGFRDAIEHLWRLKSPNTYASDRHLVERFTTAFDESGCLTLDEFVLARGNRRYLPLVKAAMIVWLVGREDDRSLLPDAPSKRAQHPEGGEPWVWTDWNRYLFDQMRTEDPGAFAANQLQVVTFNFDRSFERQLFLMIRASYGISDEDAGKLVAHVPVLHVHGSLGGPAWLMERRPESRLYEPRATDDQKVALMDEITIIHEELSRTDHLQTAHAWLSQAHTICFLGFGFHPVNVARLRMNEPHPDATIWGTAYGMSTPELGRARGQFSLNSTNQLMLDQTKDAYRYLRENGVLPTG